MSTELGSTSSASCSTARRPTACSSSINLVTPDNGEKYAIELSNATLTNIKGEQAKKPDLTITLNRTDLDR